VYENVKLKNDYFCYKEGNFYYINKAFDSLLIKSSKGEVLFSYPIDTKIRSVPLKLLYDGAYFISLHLEQGRNIIRKWLLKDTILKYVTEYDYSSIGLLSSSNKIFSKFFNRPILYDGWVESSYGNADSYFSIINNELVVRSFGSYMHSWHGPVLTRTFSDVVDFKFKCKYYMDSNNSSTRIYIYFKNNNTNVFILMLDWDNCWLWDDGTYVYNGWGNNAYDQAYNYIEFKRFNSHIELVINNKTIYIGVNSNIIFNKIQLAIFRHREDVIDFFAINNLNLFSYNTIHKIDTDTISIDSYTSYLDEDLPKKSSYIKLNVNKDYVNPGTVLVLGEESTFEEVTVTGTLAPGIFGINFFTKYDHNKDDEVNFSNNFFVFNNYQRDVEAGSIYVLDYVTGNYLRAYDNDVFYKIEASTFLSYKSKYLLGYIQSTNFIMLDVYNNLELYDVMNVENIFTDGTTVIDVHDIYVVDGSLYRLQKYASYYGQVYTWSTYNYQTTPIRSFVDSITSSVYPSIMNADGISIVKVDAVVKDQYASGMITTRVDFTEDDATGYMTLIDRYTGQQGQVYNYYRSGIIPREVKITVEAIQEY